MLPPERRRAILGARPPTALAATNWCFMPIFCRQIKYEPVGLPTLAYHITSHAPTVTNGEGFSFYKAKA
jgi:hypothetical protein